MLKKLSIVYLTLVLIGCNGFKLRGSLVIPEYLRTVYVYPYDQYEPLQNLLLARLKTYNVKIVTYANDDVTRLNLSRPVITQQVLAYGSSGEVQRYNITLTVTYTLSIKGEHAQHTNRTITRSRELNRSNNMLLSNEGEEQTVKSELLNEAVNEILRQITAQARNNNSNPC